jgi:hypothetical protein
MSEPNQNDKDYPKFATKLEEDAYWAGEHAKIEARALKAFANGTVTRGRAAHQIAELRARRAAKEPVQLDPADAQQASELAARRGVEFQEFVRGLVHDALERELSAAK